MATAKKKMTAAPKKAATPKAATPASSAAKPKFGSPAWNAKYGIGKKKTGGK
jgi:hypothetical protein